MLKKILARFFRSDNHTEAREEEHFLIKPLRAAYDRGLKLGGISDAEANAIKEAISLLQSDDLVFLHGSGWLIESLEKFWTEHITPRRQVEIQRKRFLKASDSGIRYRQSSRPVRPDWVVGLTDDFVKSISDIDKKLQGRVLVAIARITKDPITPVGDTVKPLTGTSSGLWRYRVGDYRLIYQPYVENNYIILISFRARGGAYT